MTNQPSTYTYITTATSTQVTSSSCVLVAVCLNATQTGAIKVINGTTGTSANFATYPSGSTAKEYIFGDSGVTMGNGLRIVTDSSADVTVIWKVS